MELVRQVPERLLGIQDSAAVVDVVQFDVGLVSLLVPELGNGAMVPVSLPVELGVIITGKD